MIISQCKVAKKSRRITEIFPWGPFEATMVLPGFPGLHILHSIQIFAAGRCQGIKILQVFANYLLHEQRKHKLIIL